jgi:multiple sugar transport system permease protein
MSVRAERRPTTARTGTLFSRLPFSPWHLILVPLTVIMLFPLLWMLVTSIELPGEARHFPPILIPQGIHWQNYPNALKAAPFVRFLLNSSIVSITVVISNLIFCSLA